MKDPFTRAFKIKWLGLEIWHRDKGGSDGACGWTFPHLSKNQMSALKTFAWGEAREPYYLRCPAKKWSGDRHEAESLYRALILETARMIDVKVSLEYATREAISRVHGTHVDNGADAFCYVPGYHSNSHEDTEYWREQHFKYVAGAVARTILADHRPWWHHPKWHIHHWRIRWRPITWFKLHFVWRCAYCHERFTIKSGEYPISSWEGTHHWHQRCYGVQAAENARQTAEVRK